MMKFIPLSELELDKKSFESTSAPLTRYFHQQASQDLKKRVSTCFVLVNDSAILGYYTLSAFSVELAQFSTITQKKLPRYPDVPCAKLGRLAVHKDYRSQGFGKYLLVDAIRRVSNADIGMFALIVDAKDDFAQQFYVDFGFQQFMDATSTLYLPLGDWVKGS